VATIIGISGSLRRGSYNTALLRAAAQLMPDGTQLQIRSIRGFRFTIATSKPPMASRSP
jgi:chromate reductase, NAD(P)H dehydrogenase (quinone)